MNILREIRKVKKRSIAVRYLLVLLFATFLIINTFAWYSIVRNVGPSDLAAVVTPWNVEFYIKDSENSEVLLDETATFTINEMYPGMPEFKDYVFIRNTGEKPSTIEFKLKNITLFGELIYSDEVTENELEPVITRTEVVGQDGIYSGTVDLITEGEDYPFHISYSYDKDKLSGKYESDILTPDAFAKFTMNIDWDYELLVNGLVSSDRDNLDTDFGRRAYDFYSNGTETNAIEIEVEIKALAS